MVHALELYLSKQIPQFQEYVCGTPSIPSVHVPTSHITLCDKESDFGVIVYGFLYALLHVHVG